MIKSAAATYHPLIIFLYFTLIIGVSMLVLHPWLLLIALLTALGWLIQLRGWSYCARQLVWLLPLILLTTILNPLFNHRGATVLGYFSDHNALTLESIIFGLAAGAMLGAVILWFSCMNVIFTTDKVMYLLGRFQPSLALLLAMTLRFVPQFRRRLQEVALARHNWPAPASVSARWWRLKQGLSILSITTNWSLESALTTADTMHTRGYGLKPRSCFTPYQWTRRDTIAVLILLTASALLLTGLITQQLHFTYFPVLSSFSPTWSSALYLTLWLLLCSGPGALDRWEACQWRQSISNI